MNKGIKTWPLSILLMAGTAMPAFAEAAKPVAAPAAANVMLDPWAAADSKSSAAWISASRPVNSWR